MYMHVVPPVRPEIRACRRPLAPRRRILTQMERSHLYATGSDRLRLLRAMCEEAARREAEAEGPVLVVMRTKPPCEIFGARPDEESMFLLDWVAKLSATLYGYTPNKRFGARPQRKIEQAVSAEAGNIDLDTVRFWVSTADRLRGEQLVAFPPRIKKTLRRLLKGMIVKRFKSALSPPAIQRQLARLGEDVTQDDISKLLQQINTLIAD